MVLQSVMFQCTEYMSANMHTAGIFGKRRVRAFQRIQDGPNRTSFKGVSVPIATDRCVEFDLNLI